jgi:threonine/homoserine efflux transporter RhtA
VALLGERLNLVQVAGIGIVIIAAVAAERTGRRPTKSVPVNA